MMLLKLAWLNIWRNKRRTLITTSSVFFAVLLAIAFRSVTDGVYENMIRNVVSYSSGYLQIHKKGYWEERSLDNSFLVNPQLSGELLNNPNVSHIVPRLESFALASVADKSKGIMVLGVDLVSENEVNHLDQKLTAGRFFEHYNEQTAILGDGLASQLNVQVNDTLILIGQGYHASSAAGKFPIRGILKLGSPELNENVIYLPLEACQRLFGAEDRLTSLSLMLYNTAHLESAKTSIGNSLNPASFEVMSWKQMLPEMDQFIEADSTGHYIVIAILYLIISFGLFGTLLMMAFERRREFGILIAIGMKKYLIAYMVLLESILIALIGCLAGILGGWGLVRWFTEYPIHFTGDLKEVYEDYGIESIIYFSGHTKIFITQTLIVFILAIVVAIYPGWKILRLRPVEAINR